MRRSLLLVLAVMLIGTYFYGLSDHGLIDPDEGRYSEVPREMLESSDYFTPRLNYVKYFEKPLMHYWLTALSFKALGLNEFASRLVPVLAGLLTLIITYLTAKRILHEGAAFTPLILGSSVLWFALSKLNITDMTLTFFFTLAMMGYRFWLDGGTKWLMMFYGAMAFAVLTKGLIGVVLPGGTALLHLVITKDYRRIPGLFNPLAVALFFAVTVPLFWITCRANPDFFDFFFIREHFLRYTTTIHNRYEPAYFFIPVIIAAFIPWSGLLANSFMKFFDEDISRNDRVFLALWFALPFVFFSFSGSKLIPYILPCMPPLAVMAGASLAGLDVKGFRTFMITSLVVLVPVALTGLILPSVSHDGGVIAMKYPAGMLGVCLLVFLAGGFRKSVTVMMAAGVIAMLVASPAFQKVADNSSRQAVARELGARLEHDDDAVVVAYRDIMQGLSFYLGRRIVIAEDLNELEFGAQAEDTSGWFVDAEGLKELCRSDKHVYIVTRNKHKNDLVDELSGDVRFVLGAGSDSLFVNF